MATINFRCESCGKEYRISIEEVHPHPLMPVAVGGGDWTRMRPMADSVKPWKAEEATPPIPQFTEARRTSPARAASVESDVSVPLLQSLITSVIISAGSVPLVAALHWPWYITPMVGGGTLGLSWLLLLADHRSLLRVVETVINRDIDGDGQIGNQKKEWRVKGEIYRQDDDESEGWDLFNLPCPSPEYLRAFVSEVLKGTVTFSERGASDYGYSREMWLELRDEFVDRGWVRWKHPTNEKLGVEVTAKGRAILGAIAGAPLP
jgi:hypothetical protein